MRAQTWVIGALTFPDSPKRWEKDKLFSCKEPGGCERGGWGKGEGSCVKVVCSDWNWTHKTGRERRETKLQSLPWKPISLQCGFWQQTWDSPNTWSPPDPVRLGTAPSTPNCYYMAAFWAALFGRQFQLFRRRKKESYVEGAALIFVRKRWFVGTTNIRVTRTFW